MRHDKGVSGAIRTFIDRVKSGDLGSLPVIIGLLIIWTVFQTLNPVFLSSNNLVNLLFDCSTIGVISLGIVCVLMLGEIDLSVGSISGLSSAIIGVLWGNNGWPVGVAIIAALCAGALAGFLYALLYNRFSMPSFVSTLAGLLAALGLQLYLLGNTGSINLPYGSWLVSFGQLLVMPRPLSYALALVIAMNYALTRTRWGRCVQAVGGNREAARRAGINVNFIYVSAFMACSTLAAAGGIMAAARLASSSQQAGTGDVNLNAIAAAVIGGTSLFGGRGSAWSALLGIIVIQSIASGLTLLDLSSSLRYMITGAVLAIAVIVDSLARRSRQSHGRA
ncbi:MULTISPECIES: ABC transporter permease [unclassified Brucella]|uniref:ABC transporter permease subunit n=1 Tax=unclassified Brucella TaxID=2632610 RepID=UPI0009FA00E4|nr:MULTISPECIES: ABC transporter permease [unclassified Brucella]